MLSGKRGFTLIELLIVLAITSMMLPLIGTALYLLLSVPPRESGKLTTINEVSLSLDWIKEDGIRAQCFSSAPQPRYGGFYWVDRTSGNVSHCYATRYYYDEGHLIREEWQDNALDSTIVIARHIANYGDVSFEFHPHGDWIGNLSELGLPYVVVTIKTTEGEGETEGNQYIYLRGETLSRGFAVLASRTGGNAIDISGTKLTIDGDIRSYGDISISGSDHTINGTAQAAGKINNPDESYIGSVEEYAVLPEMSWSLELSDFLDPQNPGENEYIFSGNVSLSYPEPEGYWLDATTLKPGIYYTTGTIKLSTTNASGMVTLIAEQVWIAADSTELSSLYNGVLLYGTGTGDDVVKFSGDEGTWYGTLFAPDGGVKMTGTNLTLYGAVAAQTWKTTINTDGLRIEF